MSFFSNVKDRARTARLKTKAIAGSFILTIASIAALATMSGAAASTVTKPVATPDCTGNSVVYCGATSVSALQAKYKSGDSVNKAYSISDIYDSFGIWSSDISAMNSDSVSGYVTSTGNVYAGNTLVATNAVTAGRTLLYKSGKVIPGQTPTSYGQTHFYKRAPSVSFGDSELSAMVVMKNGVFQYAILNSCGNPVTATPKKPSTSIIKQVRPAGGSSYSSTATVKSDTEVQYEITATSTGQIAAENFIVRDTMPSGVTFNSGTLELNGKSETASAASDFFGKGINFGTVQPGTKEVFTFNAIAGTVSADAMSCSPNTNGFTNTSYVNATGVTQNQSSANVKTTCTPPPAASLSCASLAAVGATPDSLTGDQGYTFTGKANEQNISKLTYTFSFGDNSNVMTIASSNTTVTGVQHTYAPGNWKATLTVSGADAATGKNYTATCTYDVSVKAPVSGTLTCDSLTDVAGQQNATTGDTPFTFTTKASTVGNAKINGYTLTTNTSGTTVPMTMSSDKKSATATHTYAPGTYTASVVVMGADLVTGKTITTPTTKTCEIPITVKTPAQPNYTIVKQVSTSVQGTYGSNVSVPSGSTVYYKIVVSSTGTTPVTNVTVSDKLPTDIAYTVGTLRQNGQVVSDASNKLPVFFAGNGLLVASIANGSSVTFTYSAVAGNAPAPTDSSCKSESLTNTGTIMSTGLSDMNSNATVGTTCTSTPPTYTYVCNQSQLVSSLNNANRSVSISGFGATSSDAKAQLTNILISWGDGTTSTVSPTSISTNSPQMHNYQINSASISVTPEFTVAGQTQSVSGVACSIPVSFTTTATPPLVMPDTGAGNTIAIFFSAIVAGTVGYRLFLSRKLSRR